MSFPVPSRPYLLSLLSYDAESGLFVRRVGRARHKANAMAGSTDAKGYRVIVVDGRRYKAHRLAWMLMTGEQPPPVIDHVDQNPANNAWGNLRIASRAQNSANSGVRRNNSSGYRGVHWEKHAGKWRALIRRAGKRISLGLFECKEEAAEVYALASEMIHGEYSNV